VTEADSYTTTRTDVIDLFAHAPRRVLDIGCSDGTFGAELRSRGAVVYGIEIDREFAARAATRLDRVLQGDALEGLESLIQEGEQFDAIVCADSLEHMVDPWTVLSTATALLDEDGVILVSLPNVHFYTTFVGLLLERQWRYRDVGIHDRTHLHWFTDRNAREMFGAAGCEVEEARAYYRLVDRPAGRNRFAPRLAVGPLKPFLTYQNLYRLRARADTGATGADEAR
jgi:SAM-dependent methyltransferase